MSRLTMKDLSLRIVELEARVVDLEGKLASKPTGRQVPAPPPVCGVCGKRWCAGHKLCPLCHVPTDHLIKKVVNGESIEVLRPHGTVLIDGVRQPCPNG